MAWTSAQAAPAPAASVQVGVRVRVRVRVSAHAPMGTLEEKSLETQSFPVSSNQSYLNAGVVAAATVINLVSQWLVRGECTESESEILLRYHRDHPYYRLTWVVDPAGMVSFGDCVGTATRTSKKNIEPQAQKSWHNRLKVLRLSLFIGPSRPHTGQAISCNGIPPKCYCN